MKKYSLDELTIPVPPYRAMRPIVSLASVTDPEPFNNGLAAGLKGIEVVKSPEVAVQSQELTLVESAVLEARAAQGVRRKELEAVHPDVAQLGREIDVADAQVRAAVEVSQKAPLKVRPIANTPKTSAVTSPYGAPAESVATLPSQVESTAKKIPQTELERLQAQRQQLLGMKGQFDSISFERKLSENEKLIGEAQAALHKAEEAKNASRKRKTDEMRLSEAETAQERLATIRARQDELRKAGDLKGADAWNEAAGKYEKYIRSTTEAPAATEAPALSSEVTSAPLEVVLSPNAQNIERKIKSFAEMTKGTIEDWALHHQLALDRNSTTSPASVRDRAVSSEEQYLTLHDEIADSLKDLPPQERDALQKELDASWYDPSDYDASRTQGRSFGDVRDESNSAIGAAHDEAKEQNTSTYTKILSSRRSAPGFTPVPAPSEASPPTPVGATPVAPPMNSAEERMRKAHVEDVQAQARSAAELEERARRRAALELAAREVREAEMNRNAEEDARAEARRSATEAELARRRAALGRGSPTAPTEAPAPAPTEAPVSAVERELAELRRSRRESASIGILRGAVEWVSRRTGAGAWLDTLSPRLKSFYHRQFAEGRAVLQEKAMSSMERAKAKLEDFQGKRDDAGWGVFKSFYSWRARVWEKALIKREGIVNKHDAFRTKRIDRHNELQRQVNDRYEREITPYRAQVEALKRSEVQTQRVLENLDAARMSALKQLATAEAKRKGTFGSGGAAAARIRREVTEIEKRINAQRKSLERIRTPLAVAERNVQKYTTKQKQVAVNMEFPEMSDLRGTPRASGAPIPERRSSETYTIEPAAQSTLEAAGERDGEVWSVDDFVEMWRGFDLNPIEDVGALKRVLEAARADSGETGPITLGEILKQTERYLKAQRKSKDFAKNKRFFLSSAPKEVTPRS